MKKKMVLSALFILMIGLLIFKLSFHNKERKFENIDRSKMFAILVKNDTINDYIEYYGDEWPTGQEFNKDMSKCYDENDDVIENVLEFESGKLVVSTDKAVYCEVYFG